MLALFEYPELAKQFFLAGYHIVAMTFSMAAEIERELISKRTKEALAARKKQGLPLGRPQGPGKSKLDCYSAEIEALLANGSTKKFVAKR